jgi:hypothetical protein
MQKLLWPFSLKGRYQVGSLVNMEDVRKCALKKQTALVDNSNWLLLTR